MAQVEEQSSNVVLLKDLVRLGSAFTDKVFEQEVLRFMKDYMPSFPLGFIGHGF